MASRGRRSRHATGLVASESTRRYYTARSATAAIHSRARAVLKADEATHPTVVRSFLPAQLPACVLVRQGVEFWRQLSLPADETTLQRLLEVSQTVG